MSKSESVGVRRLSGFSFARQWRLTRKELAETLRDRRTIVTLVLMPLLVYPLLGILFRQFLAGTFIQQTNMQAIVGLEDDEGSESPFYKRFELWLNTGNDVLIEEPNAIEPALVQEPTLESVIMGFGDSEQMLREGKVDVAVKRLRGDDPTNTGPGIEIIYADNSPMAAGVRSFIERRIRAFNYAERQRQGLEPEAASGLTMRFRKLAEVKSASRSLLPSVVPLVLLLMTITGAVYPAIDLTAGERERGTLEALIAAPVSRMGVLMAKYVAVLTVALLTAGMNLAAMSITIYSTGLASVLVQPGESILSLVVQVLGLLLLFASFFSALLLAVTSFAKSFKEAQAYLIPLMMVTLAPGLMSLSPSLELSGPLAVVPLVNVVLLARDVFSGGASLLITMVVVISTALYAGVSIALAARIFGSDAILYGSGGSWTDLFRRPLESVPAPSTVAALFCLALVFAAMITLGGATSLWMAEASPGAQLAMSAITTAIIFVGIPFLAATLENVNLLAGFRLRTPTLLAWGAALLLGVSLGVLVSEITILGLQWEIITLHPALKAAIEKKGAELNALPLPWVLITLTLVPALAEELFFRGYLFAALLRRWGAWGTIFATATAFALFHTFGASGLSLERLLPSFILGAVLGLLAYRSGSVWPGIPLHVLNNSLLLTFARYKDELVARGTLAADSEQLPAAWLAIAAVVAIVGFVVLALTRAKSAREKST